MCDVWEAGGLLPFSARILAADQFQNSHFSAKKTVRRTVAGVKTLIWRLEIVGRRFLRYRSSCTLHVRGV